MTKEIANIIVTAMLCGTAALVIITIAAFVNADEIVRAWKRWKGDD